MKNFRLLLASAVLSFLAHPVAGAQELNGAGSTAAAPIYQAWARAYQKASGQALAYEAVGSSAGLKKIRAGETGFGASDVAPSEAELAESGLTLFPVAVTGVAPVVNLPKVASGQLRLTGDVLARIFLGEITQWNAAEIAQLNPSLALPSLPIKVVVRSDGSGTTYNFADYLAKSHAGWKSKHGAKTALDWPAGFLAAKGSDAMVQYLKSTAGAIGYVDYGYVREGGLAAVQLKNADGEFISPSIPGFRAALVNSEWTTSGAFTTTLTNKPGKTSWPITMGTFVLVPKVSDRSERTQAALKFFAWAFLNGDALVQESNFVRLPDRVQARAFKAISSVKDKNGSAIGMSAMAAPSVSR